MVLSTERQVPGVVKLFYLTAVGFQNMGNTCFFDVCEARKRIVRCCRLNGKRMMVRVLFGWHESDDHGIARVKLSKR